MYIFLLGSSSRHLHLPSTGRMEDVDAFTRPGNEGRWTLTGTSSKDLVDRLLKSSLCHLFLGGSLLLAGVLVTASTLHSESDNIHGHLFVLGPILIVGGMFGLSRVMFKKAVTQQRRRVGRRRLRQTRTAGSDNTGGTLCSERPSNDSAIYLEPTDFADSCYDESPPPYDAVASDRSYLVQQSVVCPPYAYGGAMDNPALEQGNETLVIAPPSYDEVIHMQQETGDAGSGDITPSVPALVPNIDAMVEHEDSPCAMPSHVSNRQPQARQQLESQLNLAQIDTMQQTQV